MRSLRAGGLAWAGLVAAVALLDANSVQAGARRPGLAGSLLIEDADDVFVFPQQLMAYPNLISLAYGGTAGTGNGLLTLGGEELAFGVALHRGDVLAPHAFDELAALDGPASVFAAPLSLDPATIVDLLLALDRGDSELGFRLGVGAAADRTSTGDRDDGAGNTFVLAEIGHGHGTRGKTMRYDASVAFALELAATETASTTAVSGSRMHASALVRMFFPLDAALDLGVLSNIAGNFGSFSDDTGESEVSGEELGLSVSGGLGPALRLGRASVAGYGLVRFEIARDDPNRDESDDHTSRHMLALPAL
ncbi:MAG TPA: hypothetical protein VK509_19245, partial [Polyangiales bacterium]|nr:hypothetical protein [Polyangiales bacterium]